MFPHLSKRMIAWIPHQNDFDPLGSTRWHETRPEKVVSMARETVVMFRICFIKGVGDSSRDRWFHVSILGDDLILE